MELEKVTTIFNSLYENVSGRTLSLKAREDHQYKSKSFVYGEVVPDSFYEIILGADPKPGQIFYDLGSGTGKAVLLAGLLFDFEKAIGVEFVDVLYETSAEVLKHYEKEFKPKLSKSIRTKMSVIFGNFLDVDVNDADIVYLPSTCYSDSLMLALADHLANLKPGTKLISLSKKLPSPLYEVTSSKMFNFSWGQATVFYHIKK